MATKKESADTQICQLKITLKNLAPPVWRRVQVSQSNDIRRPAFVDANVMGWENSHMHQFKVGKTYYGSSYPDDFDGTTETKAEDKITVGEVLTKPKAKITYEYDFGDSWEHEIVLEKILPTGTRSEVSYVSGRQTSLSARGLWGSMGVCESDCRDQ